MRALAARGLGLDAAGGANLLPGTPMLSARGYDHNFPEAALRLWNERCGRSDGKEPDGERIDDLLFTYQRVVRALP